MAGGSAFRTGIRWAAAGMAGLIRAGVIVFILLPKGPRDPMPFDDPWNRPRDAVVANEFIAVAGTPWATDAMALPKPSPAHVAALAIFSLASMSEPSSTARGR